MDYAGKDCTREFNNAGHSLDANRILKKYQVGVLQKNNLCNEQPKATEQISNEIKGIRRKRKLFFWFCA